MLTRWVTGFLRPQKTDLLAPPVPAELPSAGLPDPMPAAPLAGIGRWGRRLVNLIRHGLNAEAAYAAQQGEVQARIGAMTAEIQRGAQGMRAGSQQADQLRHQAETLLSATDQSLHAGLAELDARLADKVGRIGQVVGVLEKIGKDLDLLALNAAIQAASAGEQGRAFVVVADHIRQLARDTVTNAHQASALLDFADFQQQLSDFRQHSTQQVAQANQQTAQAFAQIDATLSGLDQALLALDEHGRVIAAMQRLSQSTFERQRLKLSWAERLSQGLIALDALPAAALPGSIQRILRQEGLPIERCADRLAAIRARGRLRVAIEPAFKGLSFRLRPGEPLVGLDVDYAKAFARYLGVALECVEHPWDQCTELLHAGRRPGEADADLVWSALPPNAAYQGVAFSDSYTYLDFVLVRRHGDQRIQDVRSLEGKVLGCINDPAAFVALEAAGLRWSRHADTPPGTVRLANLIGYSDQGVIHDALAQGAVDAFAADHPIFAWACYGQHSPWRGQLDILPTPLSPQPWYYAVGVADDPASYLLLQAVNQFLRGFLPSREREQIEKTWQFAVRQGQGSYRDEAGGLRGEAELAADWARLTQLG